jgi:hypothetical protein
MDTSPLENLQNSQPLPACNYRWLPTKLVEPGMVTARPVVGLSGPLETMFIAIGSPLTANTLSQMVAKGVECVAVLSPPVANYSDANQSAIAFLARLQEIFGPEPDAPCSALMNAVIQAQPTLC